MPLGLLRGNSVSAITVWKFNTHIKIHTDFTQLPTGALHSFGLVFPFNLTEPRCRLESGLRAPTLSNWAVPINSCDSCVGTVVKTSVGIERSQKPQRDTSTRSGCRWDSCWLLGQSEAGMSWQRIPTWHVKCPHGCIHFISHRHEYIMKLWKNTHHDVNNFVRPTLLYSEIFISNLPIWEV